MVSFWLHRFFYTTSRYSTVLDGRLVLDTGHSGRRYGSYNSCCATTAGDY